MRAESRTLLTGEPLAWQLTNAQRIALGLAPVEPYYDRQRNLMNPVHAELLAAIRKQMKV